jgi:hypothetical protein
MVVTVLLQSLDRTNIQAMVRNTIRIGPLPTSLPRHSARRMNGYDYNPYHSVGNDPPATFSVPHGGPSHGYDYNPYHTAGNDPHPSFGMAHERRSYGYDHGPHNTASDIPPSTFGSTHEQPSHYSDHNPYYSVTNNPPPTFCLHVTSRNRVEEEYQR